MIDTHQLLVFIAAGWLLNLTPGPDVLYIVTNALKSGVRAGIVAGLGITAGCFVHIAAAAVGVGALLAASATAFTALKWLGAAYLVWMGVRMLFAKASGDTGSGAALAAARAAPAVHAPLKRVFLGGFWTNVLNPKAAIFFLAFVPQFIAPDMQNKALAFVLLGVLFNVNAIPVNAGWALAAGWMARRGGMVQKSMQWLDRVAGAMFIGFGIRLALSERPGA
ncbi:LysE family translocator [Acidovorax sp. SUPP3334]|uniref:LysE family translocator n=1 Tax=Acidovorax sp. SUPP3334 TaxID=2920881 RepID=UPI0023DE2860|nr:LysE family translocator [Acidovorax sp. SUPP3334]GKT20985.1 LysE family translocator [Acidovorax sp. SUPP3334]